MICVQSSSSKASKGLQKALGELEEERQARQKVSEELFRLERDAADLRSEQKRVKVSNFTNCVCVCFVIFWVFGFGS